MKHLQKYHHLKIYIKTKIKNNYYFLHNQNTKKK